MVCLARQELTGREVEDGDPDPVEISVDLDPHEEEVLLRVEARVVVRQRRRRHAHDLAGDDALHRRGVGHLLADRDLVAGFEQLLDVAARRVIRRTAHRDRLIRRLVATRQREVANLRRNDRVVEEELVEVTEPEEDDRVRIRGLRGEELPHDRRVCAVALLR